MRQGNPKQRMRGRGGNNNRKGPNPLTRSYESTGPDVKVRGTALHIAEKYVALARDAQSSGDRVLAENYLQHAEHYYRIIAAAQAQLQQPIQIVRSDVQSDDEDDYDDVDTSADARPVTLDAPQPFVDEAPRAPQAHGERPPYQPRDMRDREPRDGRDMREGRDGRDRDRFGGDRQHDRPRHNGSGRPYRDNRGDRGPDARGERGPDQRGERSYEGRPERGYEPRQDRFEGREPREGRDVREGREPREYRDRPERRPEPTHEPRPEPRYEPAVEERLPEPVAVAPVTPVDELPAFITGAARVEPEAPVRKRRARAPRARKADAEAGSETEVSGAED